LRVADPAPDVAELYRKYGHALYRRCLKLVGGDDEARDLVQETFVRYLGGSWRAEASPFTILYRIATNAAFDRLRARRAAPTESLDEEGSRALGATARGQGRVESAVDLAALTRGLDPQDLVVAVLHHLDGYTQDEIAESLDLSRKTVGKVLARVEEHVRKRAARMGYGSEVVIG
jgi:RNA polymerase sigma-70 factor (ECF subfamily)